MNWSEKQRKFQARGLSWSWIWKFLRVVAGSIARGASWGQAGFGRFGGAGVRCAGRCGPRGAGAGRMQALAGCLWWPSRGAVPHAGMDQEAI
jgi:hypothetical protein